MTEADLLCTSGHLPHAAAATLLGLLVLGEVLCSP